MTAQPTLHTRLHGWEAVRFIPVDGEERDIVARLPAKQPAEQPAPRAEQGQSDQFHGGKR